MVEAFFAAVPVDHTDAKALHIFRIRGKDLRYAMEVLAGAFADEFKTQLYPAVESMQERLGEVNDLVTAQESCHGKSTKWLNRKRNHGVSCLPTSKRNWTVRSSCFGSGARLKCSKNCARFDALLADPIRADKTADLAPTVNKPFRLISAR